jgi:hypothetical protein
MPLNGGTLVAQNLDEQRDTVEDIPKPRASEYWKARGYISSENQAI